MRTVFFKPSKSWKLTRTPFKPACSTSVNIDFFESNTASGLWLNSSSVWMVSPLVNTGTFLIFGYTALYQGFAAMVVVVPTNLFAPPNNNTIWLFACQRSATRCTLSGNSILLPSTSVTIFACNGRAKQAARESVIKPFFRESFNIWMSF